MPHGLDQDELIERWTLLGEDLTSSASNGGRRGWALLLKYFTRPGRFPRGRAEIADEVDLVAREVGQAVWPGVVGHAGECWSAWEVREPFATLRP